MLVSQTTKVMRSILEMLDVPEQKLAIQQISKEYAVEDSVPRAYSDAELAQRYDVNVRTARKWLAAGKIKGFQNDDGRWYTRADWVDEYELTKAGMLKEVEYDTRGA
ncbi:MerR family transcriptional regulator [Paenibacillus antibioticophila]|uniref:hypothetical protein n=1 Tax=Paenibacillus antibioticophila TaxID=1274374 RepID=UPI0005C84D08|nr:hypothetical protein [Paenibacillus antibioticophila]